MGDRLDPSPLLCDPYPCKYTYTGMPQGPIKKNANLNWQVPAHHTGTITVNTD